MNRTVAFIENGSWASASGKLMKEKILECKNMTLLEPMVSLKSSVKEQQLEELQRLAATIASTFDSHDTESSDEIGVNEVDPTTLFNLTYGLFVLSSKDKDRQVGCIVNTVTQITESPLRITVAVNKKNFTNEVIRREKRFNLSVLDESVPSEVFSDFGFCSSKDVDKFKGYEDAFTSNGIEYLSNHANSVISAKVTDILDYDTHTVFVAEVTETKKLSSIPSVSYRYYHENIKRKPPVVDKKTGFICSICGYTYDGESLPEDFICPICKHGADVFNKI